MGKVIDIDYMEPHLTGELICMACGYRYIGTWNEKVWLKELYCPNCQTQRVHNRNRSDIGELSRREPSRTYANV